ncbi:MAG: neutral zinc metallopeptidase [Thermomicrobiales bacterium]
MLRHLAVRIITAATVGLLLCAIGVNPAFQRASGTASAQTEFPTEGAADAARELSVLESERDFNGLYLRMYPDSKAIAPESAVVGWYSDFLSTRIAGILTVSDTVAEPWTWGVNGTTYEDAVTVKYVQPYTIDGVTTDVQGEVHLVPDDDGWGWFFGDSRAFLDQQISLYGDDGTAATFALTLDQAAEPSLTREELFPDPLHAHVDAFWANQFALAGRPYDPPNGVIGFDEPIVTACGRADPELEAAFYCVIDQKIYYSSDFRRLIEDRIGDFAWVIVVAHEWGHHIQAQLGLDLGVVPDRAGEMPPASLEQQADCLAGAYSIDAELTGWLDPGDIDEAIKMTEISGDPPGTAWNDPRAHGSGDERVQAFLDGYSGGISACGLDLSP